MSDDCIAGFCTVQRGQPRMRWHCRAIPALCLGRLTNKIWLPGAETRTTHITNKERVRQRLKWDKENGAAENMRLESCLAALASVTLYLALLSHDLFSSKTPLFRTESHQCADHFFGKGERVWEPNSETYTNGWKYARLRRRRSKVVD